MFRCFFFESCSLITSIRDGWTKSLWWIISAERIATQLYHSFLNIFQSTLSHGISPCDGYTLSTAVIKRNFNQDLGINRSIQNLYMVNPFRLKNIQFSTSLPLTLPPPVLSRTIFNGRGISISGQILTNSTRNVNHTLLTQEKRSPPSLVDNIFFFPQNTIIPEAPATKLMCSQRPYP